MNNGCETARVRPIDAFGAGDILLGTLNAANAPDGAGREGVEIDTVSMYFSVASRSRSESRCIAAGRSGDLRVLTPHPVQQTTSY